MIQWQWSKISIFNGTYQNVTSFSGIEQSTCLNRDLFLSCALFVPLCVSLLSRLFWVSSLAYPNLLGTKGYVVGGGVCMGHSPRVPCKERRKPGLTMTLCIVILLALLYCN
jgi:hypothetical protein